MREWLKTAIYNDIMDIMGRDYKRGNSGIYKLLIILIQPIKSVSVSSTYYNHYIIIYLTRNG